MQWLHAAPIHSGESIPRTFEVTNKGSPFILLMNEGHCRAMDERALAFLTKYAEKWKSLMQRTGHRGSSVSRGVFNPVLFYSIMCEYRSFACRHSPASIWIPAAMGAGGILRGIMMNVIGIGDVVDKYVHTQTMYPGGNAELCRLCGHAGAQCGLFGDFGNDAAAEHVMQVLDKVERQVATLSAGGRRERLRTAENRRGRTDISWFERRGYSAGTTSMDFIFQHEQYLREFDLIHKRL